MKKFFLFSITIIILFSSCKKTANSGNNNPPSDTTIFKYPTGLLEPTEDQLKNIRFVDDMDTSNFPIFSRPESPLLPSWSINVPPPGNQSFEDCAAWAVGYGIEGYQYQTIEGYPGYNSLDNLFSPSFIFNQKNHGGKGMYLYEALDILKEQGDCKWPYMPGGISYNVQPSTEARENASDYPITDYLRFSHVDVEQMKYFLSKNYPIVFGCSVDKGLMDLQKDNFQNDGQFSLTNNGEYIWNKKFGKSGGHAMLICGYDDDLNAFKVLNSWGTDWGNKGYIWIDYDFFATIVGSSLLIFPDMYIVIPRAVITKPISDITNTTATAGGNIITDQANPFTGRGVCYSTSAQPTIINGTLVTGGSGLGKFTCSLINLQSNTTYHVRAYATNSNGTTYGNDVSFATSQGVIEQVTIGTQIWMAKNLDVATYRNGDPIPEVTDSIEWENLTTGAWCYPKNDAALGAIYGKLYNQYAVQDPRGLAPSGWHVASNQEFGTLSSFLGTDDAGKMKEAGFDHWASPNSGATNSSGFTALPAGYRYPNFFGDFISIGKTAHFRTSDPYTGNLSTNEIVIINYDDATVQRFGSQPYLPGCSVRCIKD